ncbi:MAG: stage V sporulation protein AC [Clostridia bacterium]|nr:stage V sporulation protein AC [Clostridia bacterium]
MKRIETKKDYQNYVDEKTPNSPILPNIIKAFLVGGFICLIGQFISDGYKALGWDDEMVSSVTSITLVFIGIFLTALNLYSKIGKFAGAGSIVPITGFANSVASPAIEFKSEGLVLGVGAKLFQVAGPVLVYGITSSIVVGIIYYLINVAGI